MPTDDAGVSERERLLAVINATVMDVPYEGWNVREWDKENQRDLDEQIADAILAAGFGALAEVKAAAWDEGYELGKDYRRFPKVNPYRTTDTNGASE